MVTFKPKKTKERLLAAAGDVFIEKGFREATVAEICKRAEANIAAVNYHFGSKESLYQEAWRHSFTESLKSFPMGGGVSEAASAEERLRGHIESLIKRIANENNKDFFIAQMELVNPMGLLREVMKTELIPMQQHMRALVRELLGKMASEEQVHYCEISIMSMCVHPIVMQRMAAHAKKNEMPFLIDDIGKFADHVVNFALAGIDVMRNKGNQS